MAERAIGGVRLVHLFSLASAISTILLLAYLVGNQQSGLHNGTNGAVALLSKPHSSTTKDGIRRAAHKAHATLNDIADKLDASESSLQKTELSNEVQKALKAISRLEGTEEVTSTRSNHRAYANVVSEIQAIVSRQPSDKRSAKDTTLSDLRALNGIAFKDDSEVRNELKKLVSTAHRLEAEMSKLNDQDSNFDAEGIQSAAKLVEKQGKTLQSEERLENTERAKVVRRELAIAKEKLAAAEASERAATRATREARAAERLAVQKHRLAAKEEKIALMKRIAARRAHEIAAEGLDNSSPDSRFYKRLSAKIESECQNIINALGCDDLPVGSTCYSMCQNGKSKLTTKDADLDDNTPSTSTSDRSAGHAVPNELVHRRVGYFANDGDKDSYVDSVYGDPYDAETYRHHRTGFFTTMPEGVRAGQAGSDTIYGELGGSDGGGDVAANDRDVSQVTSKGAGAVISSEQRLVGRLRGALEQAAAENRMLQSRVAQQKKALHSFENGAGSDAAHQLPRY